MDLKKIKEGIALYFKSQTPEMIAAKMNELYGKTITLPKGWVSIEDHLPRMLASDLSQGYTEYKIKTKDGEELYTEVSDHNMWYHEAKKRHVTHWYNDKEIEIYEQ